MTATSLKHILPNECRNRRCFITIFQIEGTDSLPDIVEN